MIDQIETTEAELNVEELDLVQGGARKAGGDQQELTTGSQSIIAVL